MPKIVRNALSLVKIRSLSLAGRYGDGNGLYLVVDDGGAKRWVLRTLVHGKRRDMGLGSLQLVSLAEARKRAATYRLRARDGGDPIAERRQANRNVLTFKEAAEAVHASHSKGWKNPKHRDQWINTLTQYAFPEIGSKRVNAIDTADVLRVLTPIWLDKPETARRVRQRISTVLDWAKAAGHRAGDNPVESVNRGLPKQTDRVDHHAALPYAAVPSFVETLRASAAGESAKLAFEFLILTAMRTGEVIGAVWSEIDVEAKTWTIPAGRMKAKREHRVPLSDRCLQILEAAAELGGNPYVFPGRDVDVPLSNMVFLMHLRRMERTDITPHGFRSAFRDWTAEQTSFSREVCEAALAHANKDRVEAAYLRSDLFEQRRALMGQWATFACTPKTVGKVTPMKRRKTAVGR
jgi:integrase